MMIEEIARAMRVAQEDTGLKIPPNAIVIVPMGYPFDSVCGHKTIVAPTLSVFALAECDWRLAKAFEDALMYESF